jgi:hypothetical protein
MSEATIEAVVFTPAVWDVPGPVDVVATLSDGSTETVFRYFPDEIRFTAEELVGVTVEEARALHYRRGVDSLGLS